MGLRRGKGINVTIPISFGCFESPTGNYEGPAARPAHPRSGLQRPSQRRPPAKDPPPGGFSRKRPAGFVARRSQIPVGMLPPYACIPPKLERDGGSPSDRFRGDRTPLGFRTGCSRDSPQSGGVLGRFGDGPCAPSVRPRPALSWSCSATERQAGQTRRSTGAETAPNSPLIPGTG